MKVLFLVLHRKDRSPGQRYRHEQYIPYLESHGIKCYFSPLLKSKKEDQIFYSGGSTIKKAFVGIKALFRRMQDCFKANRYDFVFIYRDAFFFSTFFEKWLSKKKPELIYDFDDAIWLMDKNPDQGVFNLLKSPEKTNDIIELCDQIIVGNEYLAEHASNYNQNISIIPSTIDLNFYQCKKHEEKERICIGWTGSFSTIKHFETVVPALLEIKEKYADKVYFKVIGDPNYENESLGIKGVLWNSKTEVADLSELDIGLMPLPDNEWSQGKCAMKGLQYMALGIPAIMSPVGVNKEIIQDGENGFLASGKNDWVEKISLLFDNLILRKSVGEAGRKTVEKDFSVEGNQEKWLSIFKN